jgi:hypothetical protein
MTLVSSAPMILQYDWWTVEMFRIKVESKSTTLANGAAFATISSVSRKLLSSVTN